MAFQILYSMKSPRVTRPPGDGDLVNFTSKPDDLRLSRHISKQEAGFLCGLIKYHKIAFFL